MAKHHEVILLMNCPLFIGKISGPETHRICVIWSHAVCLASPTPGTSGEPHLQKLHPSLPFCAGPSAQSAFLNACECLLATLPLLCTSPLWEQRAAETAGEVLPEGSQSLSPETAHWTFFLPEKSTSQDLSPLAGSVLSAEGLFLPPSSGSMLT